MTYPAINPTSRVWTPGQFGQSSFDSASGAEVRIRYGSVATRHSLALGYSNISEANAIAFNDDYASRQGEFETFNLPAEVFAGMTNAFGVGINRWRYTEPPSIESVKSGIYNVSVSLIAVLG